MSQPNHVFWTEPNQAYSKKTESNLFQKPKPNWNKKCIPHIPIDRPALGINTCEISTLYHGLYWYALITLVCNNDPDCAITYTYIAIDVKCFNLTINVFI